MLYIFIHILFIYINLLSSLINKQLASGLFGIVEYNTVISSVVRLLYAENVHTLQNIPNISKTAKLAWCDS